MRGDKVRQNKIKRANSLLCQRYTTIIQFSFLSNRNDMVENRRTSTSGNTVTGAAGGGAKASIAASAAATTSIGTSDNRR